MKKICLVYQPCGGGDILWISKILHTFKNKGYEIFIPVVEEYADFQNYMPWFNYVSWQDKANKLTHKDKLPESVQFPYKEKYDPYAPCEFSESFVYINGFLPPQIRVMEDKYRNAGISTENWQDYVIFNRNHEKENELYYNILGLQDDTEFVFVNRNYQMRPYPLFYGRISNNPADYGGKKVVEMQIIDGFSIFDWCKVMEKASEIWTIETSINYVLESPEMRDKITKNLHLFSRHNSFHEVSGLFKLPWNYH